ncbi:MAG: hypothetical protein E6J90_22335 [Deltaproteobacteria bacterium]|nr:MAG: hypothetical protein E6J91_46540 [Deltaproteobacteria bacterium]TMQ17461.1 MAG: hypothetical protein E6J90_22335 [Deltaproteobacteria bacterium]
MTASGYVQSSKAGPRARRIAEIARVWLDVLTVAWQSATRAVRRRFQRAHPWSIDGDLPVPILSAADPAAAPEPASLDVAPSADQDIGDETLAASFASTFSAWASSAGVLGERDDSFLPIPVAPWFGLKLLPEVIAQLQTPPMAKLLDLTHVQTMDVEMFANLAAAWTAPATAMPRLGILVSFERWATLRDAALVALQPLAGRGIRVQIFYEQQAWGGQLDAWFRHGQIVHNLPAAIAKLGRRWEPPPSWPAVIDELARLVRAYSRASEIPALLTEIAEVALSCGGDDRAAMLVHEALFYLHEEPSATTSKALRVLGATHIAQGRTETAIKLLDRAIAMAAEAQAPAIEASALCQNGLLSLNHGDYVSAEQRFRRAIDLLAPSPDLLAVAHHHLAIALMFLGSREAEHHAQTALALRGDPDSHLAEADRMLLARLRALNDSRANE